MQKFVGPYSYELIFR